MPYLTEYALMSTALQSDSDMQTVEGLPFVISRWIHKSDARNLLPGRDNYYCELHNRHFPVCHSDESSIIPVVHESALHLTDFEIEENHLFSYFVLSPTQNSRFDSAILLLHGLNEQHWKKCLPWALGLARRCSSPVILMPLALHMHRSHPEWCKSRKMNKVSLQRQNTIAGLHSTSFSNAAISTRLHEMPSRLFWIAMQSCADIVALATLLSSGKHPLFHEGTSMDFFGYSIGAFLSQIVLMTAEKPFFDTAKAVLFCGGTTLDRMHLIDRAILDSAAWDALRCFYGEDLGFHCDHDARLCHYVSDEHPYGRSFRLLTSFASYRIEREAALQLLQNRIVGIVLEGDTVMTPADTLPVLKGDSDSPGIVTHILDYPYPYSHIMPFPTQTKYRHLTADAVNDMLDRAASHLCKG